jgi:hypothetical protein
VGGAAIDADLASVNMYWKGNPPSALQTFATTLSAPVKFRVSQYSDSELGAAAESMLTSYQSWVSSAGPSPDYSSVAVTLTADAPANSMATMSSQMSVPLVFMGVDNPEPASRDDDYAPWFGGSLIYRVSPAAACSTGVAASIGSTSYVTTAWHCGTGTWRSYTSGHSLGAVGPRNYLHDIEMIKTTSNPRIWLGAWNTSDSDSVYTAKRPTYNMRVYLSGGVSGTPLPARYVVLTNQHWNLPGQPNVGPGFVFGPGAGSGCGGTSCSGVFARGDSGSPVFRYTGSGAEISGFLSASYGTGTWFCPAGIHPDFGGTCWASGRTVYSTDALASLGATIKTG